jgi:hypothetical protein
MTFNPSIPTAGQLISASQAQIQTNFSQLDTAFAIDHTAFSVSTNQGKHKHSTYVEQPVDATTLVNEMAVYCKDTGTQPDLFYRPQSNGTAVRLTGGGVTAGAWCVFDGTAVSPISPGASFNVTNITRSTNTYTLNFTRAFASANYAVVVTPSLNTTDPIAIQITQSTTTCQIVIRTNGAGTSGGNNISVVCFGTLV